jgi:hypothetical protein
MAAYEKWSDVETRPKPGSVPSVVLSMLARPSPKALTKYFVFNPFAIKI